MFFSNIHPKAALSVYFNKERIPFVSVLLRKWNPFAIGGAIVPVWVNALYCQRCGVAVRECPLFEFSRRIGPIIAYLYSASAVIMEGRMLWVMATAYYSLNDAVNSGARVPVCARLSEVGA